MVCTSSWCPACHASCWRTLPALPGLNCGGGRCAQQIVPPAGVTAYQGAIGLIMNESYIPVAAGIEAVEVCLHGLLPAFLSVSPYDPALLAVQPVIHVALLGAL